ncbi:tetratricopeptide repeat protein [Bacillus clarus]|uniref:Tetratricopeptide repeat family protein n=1 Tax=Bacillus clarus TaxID=2338372 RepID=A0A090YTZ7_9BACI|nr:Rap family tetratricopeptide repeat protein [Bacillus clarus]KFM95550.1 tetratricopeptide repeat family protein [Bacillus clarus]RFT64342.1 tetratricopeptide repeat protein [Bacillus clarus]
MSIHLKGNKEITKLLNEWYIEIRSRRIRNALCLKETIDSKIHSIEEDQNLLLYYSLLDFRYQFIIDNLSVSKNSFDKVESFDTPTDDFLAYYYHFFKGIHASTIGEYNVAKENYEKAESFLDCIPDELEKAEFQYKVGAFLYDIYQGLLSYKKVTEARKIFAQHTGYEINVAFCDNLIGLACTHLREWELAEEYFTKAMDMFQKINEEQFILMVRQNLGLMYATQNLSPLAIRYLSEVNQKQSNNYKALFIEAREHMKQGNNSIATELIAKGHKLCVELDNKEYKYHFKILDAINANFPAEALEKIVLESISYFTEQELFEYIKDYEEQLATTFYKEDNHVKASHYFYSSSQAGKKAFEKEALK